MTLPAPSIITTWTSSNLAPLSAAYCEVPGLSPTVFQGWVVVTVVPPTVEVEIATVCCENQSVTAVGVFCVVSPLLNAVTKIFSVPISKILPALTFALRSAVVVIPILVSVTLSSVVTVPTLAFFLRYLVASPSLCSAADVLTWALVTPVIWPTPIVAPLREMISFPTDKKSFAVTVIPAVTIPTVVAEALNGDPPGISRVNELCKKYESIDAPAACVVAVETSAPLVAFAEVVPAPAPTNSVATPFENL